MDQAVIHNEDENRKKGIIVSFMIHALLLLIALIPYLNYEDVPEEVSGIVVAFGNVEAGSSNANPISSSDDYAAEETPKANSSTDSEEANVAPIKQEATEDPTPKNIPVEDITPVTENSDVAFEEAQKEKARKEAEAAEAVEKKRQAEEAARLEAERKAEEEEAKKAAYDKSKSKFSDLLGTGKGNNDNSGTEGDPKGDPNSDALDKIATGSGRIGGGLKDRGVLFEPEINDNSQYTGVVVVKVCVDKQGKVVEAKFTQMGSTTTNKSLVDLAVDAAKRYQFTSSEIDTQCGNITIEFKVR